MSATCIDPVPSQDIVDARDLVRRPSLSERRMHYLEHETAVYTSRTGRLYTIYGSPVRNFFLVPRNNVLTKPLCAGCSLTQVSRGVPVYQRTRRGHIRAHPRVH